MCSIPALLHTIPVREYVERLRIDRANPMELEGYEIVYSLTDDKPADLVRAFQETAILKTRIKLKRCTLPSFWDVWHDPQSGLATDIFHQSDPHEAKWALSRKYGYKLATTFMPTYAKSIYEYFGAKHVLDPCAGWGDRLVGAVTASCVETYVGFDPNRELIPGYVNIMAQFGHTDELPKLANVRFNNGFDVYSMPFERGIVEFPDESFDFAFTSPPYFDYEEYSPSNPKYRDWIRDFYTPLFRETARVLQKGCVFAIHIGDTSAGQIGEFLKTVDQICDLRYRGKIGLVGAQSNKVRDVHLFVKTGEST